MKQMKEIEAYFELLVSTVSSSSFRLNNLEIFPHDIRFNLQLSRRKDYSRIF